ncbi:hypothetical protein Kpol_1039p23 [Vanderwaltozyma polyspora DSM 70294]|uniref:Nucleoporin Nup159/Nup146 N-terminal domain-containing protein n=1 Tax=Vanderwaltozyma polyspora (strain ATCC 22028 / DSM 70294 / BCRC 21397 / CBS 2163 / NBRC 10782 / NRRL Y-8283 / UCD 57-17) TaxID=436907 RepID=A7THF0_VANPO|nr:uncharacterized protein Kpol_1039p23 [Vanderwaltozyma polyspora DSM 70294]EDO18274.1 hypothetical protein Kpol_1039p23 [Vanderwaltozyma polyspora DSM 70294]
MSVVGDDLETVVSEEFGFKPLGQAVILPSYDEKLPYSSLHNLDISNKRGLYVATSGDKTVIGKVQDLRDFVSSSEVTALPQFLWEKDITGVIAVKFYNNLVLILNTDGQLSSIDCNDLSKDLENIHKFESGILEFKLSANTLFLLSNNYQLFCYNISADEIVPITNEVIALDVFENLLVAINSNGIIKFYEISGAELNEFESFGYPDQLKEEFNDEYKPISITVLDKARFLVVFGVDVDTTEDMISYDHKMYIVAKKESEFIFKESYDILPAFGSVLRYPTYYNIYLKGLIKENQELNVLGSACSSELTILDKLDIVQPSQDSERAVLPINKETDNDTNPIGIAIDVCTDGLIGEPCQGVDKIDHMALIYILTNEGKLIIDGLYDSTAIKNDSYNVNSLKARIINENEGENDSIKPFIKNEVLKENAPILSSAKISSGTDDNKTPTFSQPSFGIPNSNTLEPSNFAFGKPSFGSPASSSPFSAFSTTATEETSSSTAFGKPAFGAPSFNSFKSSTETANQTFGAPSFGTPSFGSSSSKPDGSTESSVFGKPTFGQSSFSASAFQAKESSSGPTFGQSSFANSTFGNLAGSNKSTNIFGSASSDKADNPFLGASNGNSPFANLMSNKPAVDVESPFSKFSISNKVEEIDSRETNDIPKEESSTSEDLRDSTVEQMPTISTPLASKDISLTKQETSDESAGITADNKPKESGFSISSLTDKIKKSANISENDLNINSFTKSPFETEKSGESSPFSNFTNDLNKSQPASFAINLNDKNKELLQDDMQKNISESEAEIVDINEESSSVDLPKINDEVSKESNNNSEESDADSITTQESYENVEAFEKHSEQESDTESLNKTEFNDEPNNENVEEIKDNEEIEIRKELEVEEASTKQEPETDNEDDVVEESVLNREIETKNELQNGVPTEEENEINEESEIESEETSEIVEESIVVKTIGTSPANSANAEIQTEPLLVFDKSTQFEKEYSTVGHQTDKIETCDFNIQTFEDDESYVALCHKPSTLKPFFTGATIKGMKYLSDDPNLRIVESTYNFIEAELLVLSLNLKNMDEFLVDQSTTYIEKRTDKTLNNIYIWRLNESKILVDILSQKVESCASQFSKQDDLLLRVDELTEKIKKNVDEKIKFKEFINTLDEIVNGKEERVRDLTLYQSTVQNNLRNKIRVLSEKINRIEETVNILKMYTVNSDKLSDNPLVSRLIAESVSRGNLLDEIKSLRGDLNKFRANSEGAFTDESTSAEQTALAIRKGNSLNSIKVAETSLRLNTKQQLGLFFEKMVSVQE